MANIISRLQQAMGGQRNQRDLSDIENIAVHWSGVTNGAIEKHERYWRDTLGWGVGGYHYAVTKNGTILHNYNLERTTNGVGGHNSKTAHVMYEGGYGAPMSEAQKEAVKYVINELMLPNLPNVENILGHNEFANTSNYNHSANACPGIDMNDFRAYLKDNKVNVSAPSPKPVKEATVSFNEVVQQVIDGKHGNYPERQANVERLGHDYDEVQRAVNAKFSQPKPAPKKKSVNAIAQEVIDNKWGNGDIRRKRLEQAGYNYSAVQKRVNEMLAPKPKSKSINQLAQEVIDGKHGSGDARKRNLGSQYKAVQRRVNELLGASGSNKKSIDTIAKEVIDGKWGNDPERSRRLRNAGYDANAVQRRVNQIL